MEIIKKNSIAHGAKFRVLRPFYFQGDLREEDVGSKPPGPAMVRVGDILEIKEPIEQVSLCKCGKVSPILPETAIYVALTSITLPGCKEKFEAQKMELIELKAADAVGLLLSGSIIPKDDFVWRPFWRSLKPKNQVRKVF